MDCQSFDPICTAQSRVLILGSMPGIASLEAAQYYAHPRNAFWPILFDFFGQPFSRRYEDRCRLIADNGLALWDVLKTCQREGSLDTAIRDIVYNDFDRLFRNSGIQSVVCNGQKAYGLFMRSGAAAGKTVYAMPSTSPAYTLAYSEKSRIWQACLTETLRIKNG